MSEAFGSIPRGYSVMRRRGAGSCGDAFLAFLKAIARGDAIKDIAIWNINSAVDVLNIAADLLDGQILAATGDSSHYGGYLKFCSDACSGISFIDATSLKVCHNRRIHSHKVFKDTAARRKTSIGWFYGLKLRIQTASGGERLPRFVRGDTHAWQFR